MERRLAAILAADAVGYSRQMGVDEEAAFSALSARRAIIGSVIEEHAGRVFGSAGDSVVAEFHSTVEAVRSALEIQRRLQEANTNFSAAEPMTFRIGVNFGDVIFEDGDIYGDGVNVAARLEALAPPGGVCISGQVAEQIAGKLDVVFAAAGPQTLKNIAKPVEVWIWPPEKAAKLRRGLKRWQRASAGLALSVIALAAIAYFFLADPGRKENLPTGSRIALIPFKNLGSDPEDAYFSDGLTRDINAYLSKFSNLFVIAPAAGNEFREAADCAAIRDKLQADYILTGAVRRSLDKLRVTTTFTDARTCRQLDAPGPFDRDLSLASVLDIQLEIAKKVAAEVGSADAPLFNAEVQNAIRREAPDNLVAYECVLLSYWFYETFAPERHRRARACLERAVKIDPDYSLGWSRLAFSYIETKKYGIDTPADWAELSRQAANRAIDLDPDNPNAYYALAILSQMLGDDKTVFRNFAERAIELNPNDAFVLADLGTWIAYTGAWDRGKELVTRAKLLNPNHQSWWDWIWLLHHYLKGEYRQAHDIALKINLPNNYMIQAALTATYGMLDEQQKTNEALAHLLEIRPDYPLDPRAPFRVRGMQTELIEALMEGLRKAGLQVPAAE
jgi:class 3 adenylate cyclase/TolB-like protein